MRDRKQPSDVAENIQETTVEREAFEDVLRSLVTSAPITKNAISRKIELRGRRRPLTRPLRDPDE